MKLKLVEQSRCQVLPGDLGAAEPQGATFSANKVRGPCRADRIVDRSVSAMDGVSTGKARRANLKEERAAMQLPPIVSPQEWKSAREELLVKEKELTHAHDALAAERRRMPRMAIEKDYTFAGPDGPVSLLDLFEGRRQLIVYRFFFEPGVHGWPEGGCTGCSRLADQMTHQAHLNARDTTLALVSRAPQPDIQRYRARMGWEDRPWYTITDDFDADFNADEWHATLVFYRDDEDRLFLTYLLDGRGDEMVGGIYSYLDITPLGRQEEWEDSPEGYPQGEAHSWVKLHDEYDGSGS